MTQLYAFLLSLQVADKITYAFTHIKEENDDDSLISASERSDAASRSAY